MSRSRLAARVCASLLLGAFVVGTAGTASAASADPVAAAITGALRAHDISPVQARDLRRTWVRSARDARRAPTATRRATIVAARAYATRIARRGQLAPDRLETVLLGIDATARTMTGARAFPAHESELSLSGEPVVFTYYAGRGVQFQPFESFKLGMQYLNAAAPDVDRARALAERMLELSQMRGTARVWEYCFPFNGPDRPWTSAISQALATEFYFRLAALAPAEDRTRYEQAAAQTANSFLRSTRTNGVGTPEGAGRYYVMYSFDPTQRILNGHLQSLINLNRYAKATGSPVARRAVELGIASVLPLLPRFDTGAWSNYLPHQEAELGYHEFQTSQLVKLGAELDDPVAADEFAQYGARFSLYLITPPTLQFTSALREAIVPARDGYRDSIRVGYRVDKHAKVTMVVRDADGIEVARVSDTSDRTNAGAVIWTARNDRGSTVPDGSYTARLTVTDVAGNRSFLDVPGTLDVARDTIAPTLASVAVAASGARASIVSIRANDAGSAWIDAELRIAGVVVARTRAPRAGNFRLRVPRPAATTRRAALVLRDSSGNELVQPLARPLPAAPDRLR